MWVKELTLLAKAARAAKRLDLAAQITRAAVETVRHGEAPSADLVTALAALGATHAVTALAAWIADATARAAIDDDLWRAAAPHLGATLDAHPEALAAVIDLPPTRHPVPARPDGNTQFDTDACSTSGPARRTPSRAVPCTVRLYPGALP